MGKASSNGGWSIRGYRILGQRRVDEVLCDNNPLVFTLVKSLADIYTSHCIYLFQKC